MSSFALHTPETAPDAAKPILAQIEKDWGAIPNLTRVAAESPVLLDAVTSLREICEKTSLTGPEKHVVYMAVSFENACRNCMAKGTMMMGHIDGFAEDDAEALRTGAPLQDSKLQALRAFVVCLVRSQGFAGEADLAAFLKAGYTRQQALDVMTIIAFTVMTNFTNNLADTPLDDFAKVHAWEPQVVRSVA